MQTATTRQLVRPMTLSDIAQVMEVEQQSFPTMWPPTAFRREIQHNRLARFLVAVRRREDAPRRQETPPSSTSEHGSLGRLLGSLRHVLAGDDELPPPAERDELVVGFIGVWLLIEEAHIVTVAVRDGHRGRGVGELLLIAAIETALKVRQPVLSLECRVSNQVALRLYEKYGFQRTGLRPRYYSDNNEDAYVLTASGIDAPSYGRLFRRLRDELRDRCGEYELDL